MRKILTYTICFLVCAVVVAPLAAQQGSDPLSGTWTGDWGPSARDRNPVTVEFKWDGATLSGSVNPGPNAIALQKATFNPQTGDVHLEADAMSPSGRTIHYVIVGKLAGGSMTGSWNHDNVRGDFKIAKK